MRRSYFFARAAQCLARLYLRAIGTRPFVGLAFTRIIVLGVLVSVPRNSFAQVPNFVANTVRYGVSGSAGAILSGTDFAQTFGIRNEQNNYEAFPVSLEKNFAASFSRGAGGLSTAFVFVTAHAETGSLRVDVSGELARTSSATDPIGEAQLISAFVQARWQDTTFLTNRLNPMPGRLIHLKSVLELDGTVDTSVLGSSGGGLAASQVSLSLSAGLVRQLNPLPNPPYGGLFAESRASTQLTVGVSRPAPEMIDVDLFVTEGELFTMDILMEARASGTARQTQYISSFGNPTFSTRFSASFGHTLRWGGITSVTDAQTGEPIEGWVITSASGFDYAHPAPVPEPTSVGLVLWGLLGFVCRRIRV